MLGFHSRSRRLCHRSASASISAAPAPSPIALPFFLTFLEADGPGETGDGAAYVSSLARADASPYIMLWISGRQPAPEMDCSWPSLPGPFHKQSCSTLTPAPPGCGPTLSPARTTPAERRTAQDRRAGISG